MKKEIMLKDFVAINSDVAPIVANGYWDDVNNHWNINYSSILTKLIQEVGQNCKNYASDLFIDWVILEEMLKDKEIDYSFLFGIREMGVDSKTFVLCRYNDNSSDTYYKIYRLDIKTEEDKYRCKTLNMKLYEADTRLL